MPKTVEYTNLLGETVSVKARGRHYVKPNGYARPPGTGPAGETCGSCLHLIIKRMGKAYHKCDRARGLWTGGRGSDVLVRSPACEQWAQIDTVSNPPSNA